MSVPGKPDPSAREIWRGTFLWLGRVTATCRGALRRPSCCAGGALSGLKLLHVYGVGEREPPGLTPAAVCACGDTCLPAPASPVPVSCCQCGAELRRCCCDGAKAPLFGFRRWGCSPQHLLGGSWQWWAPICPQCLVDSEAEAPACRRLNPSSPWEGCLGTRGAPCCEFAIAVAQQTLGPRD